MTEKGLAGNLWTTASNVALYQSPIWKLKLAMTNIYLLVTFRIASAKVLLLNEPFLCHPTPRSGALVWMKRGLPILPCRLTWSYTRPGVIMTCIPWILTACEITRWHGIMEGRLMETPMHFSKHGLDGTQKPSVGRSPWDDCTMISANTGNTEMTHFGEYSLH